MSDYTQFISRSFPLLLKGVAMTIQVMGGAALLSFFIGTLFGLFSSKRLKIPLVSSLIEGITFVLRGVPFYVQLLIVYFVLPDLIGFNLNPFMASIIALGLCSAGYIAQIVRGGINAIPVIQWESAEVLGYSDRQTAYYIVLPQLLRNILPMLSNELESLLKSTAIVSSIGMLELTRVGMNIVSREMDPVPTYLTIALFYLVMSSLLTSFARMIERRLYVAG